MHKLTVENITSTPNPSKSRWSWPITLNCAHVRRRPPRLIGAGSTWAHSRTDREIEGALSDVLYVNVGLTFMRVAALDLPARSLAVAGFVGVVCHWPTLSHWPDCRG